VEIGARSFTLQETQICSGVHFYLWKEGANLPKKPTKVC